MEKLEAYLKAHPKVSFSFRYDPEGLSMWGDNKCWQVKFASGTNKKVQSLCGYACETFDGLIEHLVNELP